MTAVKTAAAIAAASILTAAPTTTNAFVVPTANTAIAFRQSTKLRMSSTEDEVAKLRAAAEKMRAEANALAKVSSDPLPIDTTAVYLFKRGNIICLSKQKNMHFNLIISALHFFTFVCHRKWEKILVTQHQLLQKLLK